MSLGKFDFLRTGGSGRQLDWSDVVTNLNFYLFLRFLHITRLQKQCWQLLSYFANMKLLPLILTIIFAMHIPIITQEEPSPPEEMCFY